MTEQDDCEVINMAHNYGECSFCGGEVHESRIMLDYWHHGQLFVFHDVPAGVCDQCGEQYLMASVAKALERELTSAFPPTETLVVPVIRWSQRRAAVSAASA